MQKTFAACLFTALVTACTMPDPGPDGPVPPVPPPPPSDMSSLTGVVEIDAAIPNAVVFLDEDGDNKLSAGEPSTTTDATGHYTITWPSYEGQFAPTVGAIVNTGSIAIHLRAPLTITYQTFNQTAVISPLTTLVASEMMWNQSVDQTSAEAQLVASLKASTIPFSGQPLDLMADYLATTSSDNAQLRLLASAIAVTVSDAVKAGNTVQSEVDCNDNMIFTPAIAAMDDQLTALASAVYKFEGLTAAQRADIQNNPAGYPDYFINSTDFAMTIENELEAAAEEAAADLFAEFQAEFAAQLEDDVVELVAGELIAELLG